MAVCYPSRVRFLATILLFVASVALVTLAAPEALAWKRASASKVTVHAYRFDKVVTERVGKCTITLRLRFRSPRDGVIRLRAAVRFHSGGEIWTGVAEHHGVGVQTLEYAHDTADAGCWGDKAQQPAKLVVSACFEDGCQPAPLPRK